MVVGVDEPRQDDVIVKVEDFIGGVGEFGHGSDFLDESAANKKTTIGNFPLMVVHGEDVGVLDE